MRASVFSPGAITEHGVPARTGHRGGRDHDGLRRDGARRVEAGVPEEPQRIAALQHARVAGDRGGECEDRPAGLALLVLAGRSIFVVVTRRGSRGTASRLRLCEQLHDAQDGKLRAGVERHQDRAMRRLRLAPGDGAGGDADRRVAEGAVILERVDDVCARQNQPAFGIDDHAAAVAHDGRDAGLVEDEESGRRYARVRRRRLRSPPQLPLAPPPRPAGRPVEAAAARRRSACLPPWASPSARRSRSRG